MDDDAETTDELAEMVLIPLESLPPAEVDDEDEAGRNGYYFVVFYAAVYDHQEDHIKAHAVSMFIGSNYLVTVHTGSALTHRRHHRALARAEEPAQATVSASWCMPCSTPWWMTTSP